jgi:hypothetical protein
MTRSLALYGKTRHRRMTPEATLQKTVMAHMSLSATPGAWAMSIPNERECSAAQMKHLKEMGLLPGAADLLVIVPGRMPLWLELKAKGKEPSLEQDGFGQLARESGHHWCWADNIADALHILREFRALKPEAKLRRAA